MNNIQLAIQKLQQIAQQTVTIQAHARAIHARNAPPEVSVKTSEQDAADASAIDELGQTILEGAGDAISLLLE